MLEVPELQSGNPQLQRALNKIAKLEQKPIDRLDEKIQKTDGKLKLVRDLKGKIGEIRDAVKPFKTVQDFRELTGISSNAEVASPGAIDKNVAKPGNYEFEVLELANANSLMTKGFPDRDRSEVGVGYITFKDAKGESHDVYINSDNNTLDGVANSINQSGLGVKAQVVNDGSDADEPWRLVISSDKTGWKNNLEWPEFNFLDGDFDLDQDKIRDAKSAKIRFEGQDIMVDENTIKDLIPGVNVDLKKAKPGETVKISIKPDFEKIEGKAKNFVDKLNGVFTFIQSQAPTGPDSWKDPKKALGADSSIRTLEQQLRNLVQNPVANLGADKIQRLRDMGIVFNRAGTLDYDGKKFQAELEKNFNDVATFFSGTGPLGGFAAAIDRLADTSTRSNDGTISMREKNFQDQITRMNKDKETVTTRATKRLELAKGQFARAEEAMSQMQSMGGAVAQGIGGGG